MTLTVSISQFRNNISGYLDKAARGMEIVIRDEKRGQEVAQLTARKKFDLESFKKVLKKTAGVFTAENHPEWRTKEDVIKWVEKGRAAADRTF